MMARDFVLESFRFRQLLVAAEDDEGVLAALLGVSPSTVYKWRREGRISLAGACLAELSDKLAPYTLPNQGLFFSASRLRPGYSTYRWESFKLSNKPFQKARAKQEAYERGFLLPLVDYKAGDCVSPIDNPPGTTRPPGLDCDDRVIINQPRNKTD